MPECFEKELLLELQDDLKTFVGWSTDMLQSFRG